MILFSTQSAKYLAEKITIPKAQVVVKQFSDGELYIKIEEDISGKEVWIIASTQPPAENLLELFFLLDALVRKGAQKINIFFSYFSYARQIIPLSGEAASAQLLCDILKKFPLNKIYIMHAHAAPTLYSYLNFKNVIDMNFFCQAAKNYDVIAAPDKGAFEFSQEVAATCNKEVVFLKKTRPEHEQVRIESVDGAVQGKKVLLVDDIIATGRTLIEASQALKNLGATEIAAAATHGIFSDNAHERLAHSSLSKIYVTNTLKHHAEGIIEVIDVSAFIESVITK